MWFLFGRCDRCGGNLYWDEEDRTIKCLACANQLDEEGRPIRRLPPIEPYHYQVSFKIPRNISPDDFTPDI